MKNKYPIKFLTTFITLILMGVVRCVEAQEVAGFTVNKKQALPGEEMIFMLQITNTYGRAINCSVLVEFGNGVSEYVRVSSPAVETDLRFPVTYKYPGPGTYTVTAKGKLLVRGLATLAGCNGEKNETVTIADPQAIKMKLELDRIQRELKDREEKEALRREQEIRQREQEIRQREDELRRREEEALRVRIREEEALRIRLETDKNRTQPEQKRSPPTSTSAPKPAASSLTPNPSGF